MHIPDGLGTIESLMKRCKKAIGNWELWRSLHQEAYDFSAPQRETFRFHSPGQTKNRHVYDSTAVDGLQTFAARIHGSMVPSWKQWTKFEAGSDIPKDEVDSINKDLEEINEIVFNQINLSNFSTEISSSLIDLGIGTGAIEVEEVEFGAGGSVLMFTNVPLAELYPEKPARGPIINTWKRFKILPGDIKTTWPEAELSEELIRLEKNNSLEEVELKIGHLFNKKDKRYHQIVMHEESKHLIFTQSFKTKRTIVFRWSVVPGEIFGRGPIMQIMADIRTANKVKEFTLKNGAIQMAGIYTGVDDGIFNPHTARIAPGVIIPVGSNLSSNPSMRALERSGDLGLGELILADLQNTIKRALFANPLGEVTDPVKSATEQLIRMQEMLKSAGAQIGRQKTEMAEPIMAAVVDILSSLGEIPKIEVDGKEVKLRHTSPLAQAEDLDDFQNSQVWFGAISLLPPEVVAVTVKVEELPKYWGEKLGISAALIRTEDEAKQVVDDAKQQAIEIQEGQNAQ